MDKRVEKGLHGKENFLFALWHEDILPILMRCTFVKPCIALVSSSQDGDILAHFLKRKGLICARGSSRTKAIEATKELIRLAKLHHANIAFAIDGSKGPRHEVKPGVFALSHFLDYNICFVVARASHRYIFQKSWDKSYIPLPFSRISIYFGFASDPITKKAYRESKDLSLQLKEVMLCVKKEVVKD